MIIGSKDRTYYRLEDNDGLIEEAKYNPSIELCIVLGERLEDIRYNAAKTEEDKK